MNDILYFIKPSKAKTPKNKLGIPAKIGKLVYFYKTPNKNRKGAYYFGRPVSNCVIIFTPGAVKSRFFNTERKAKAYCHSMINSTQLAVCFTGRDIIKACPDKIEYVR